MGAVEPTIGGRYAYRARGTDPLVQVELLKIGTQKPARVFVRWIDDTFEGKQEWVPPARLKTGWAQVGEYIADEKRWANIRAVGPPYDDHEAAACWAVFELLVDAGVAEMEYNDAGLLTIRNAAELAQMTGLPEDDLLTDPLGFNFGGGRMVSWNTSSKAGRALARRFADQVAAKVEKDEAEARRDAIHGRHYRGRYGDISPEICRQVDEESYAPVREILRRWCGSDAVDRIQELNALREEVRRIGVLATEAIDRLEKVGDKVSAADLRRRLGVPVESLRTPN